MAEAAPSMSEILTASIAARENEVMMYQININNYVAAIANIDANHSDDPDMAEFRARLDGDLTATKREQKKSQLMLDAAVQQLASLG